MHRRMRRLLHHHQNEKNVLDACDFTYNTSHVKTINGHYSSRGGILENLIHELIVTTFWKFCKNKTNSVLEKPIILIN